MIFQTDKVLLDLPGDRLDIAKAVAGLSDLAEIDFDANEVEIAVQKNWLKTAVVTLDGKKMVFWFAFFPNGSLVAHHGKSLEYIGRGLFFDGLDALAKHFDAPEVIFFTRRRGLVKLAKGRGYALPGWLVVKKY